MMRTGSFLTTVLLAAVVWSCGDKGKDKNESGNKAPTVDPESPIDNSDPEVDAKLGEGNTKYSVVGKKAHKKKVSDGSVLSSRSKLGKKALNRLAHKKFSNAIGTVARAGNEQPESGEKSLLLGFPVRLLEQGFIFGGVFTKVSDTESSALGRLKLIELDPLHVRPFVVKDDAGQYYLTLVGCVRSCNETSARMPLFNMPLAGISSDLTEVYVDVGTLSKGLSLISLVDPNGDYTGLQEISSSAAWADFSQSTLVFDVITTMVPKISILFGIEDAPETKLTVRWYLKLESELDSSFSVREPTKGVGFFGTARNANEKITRFSLSSVDGDAPIHYYIKNVPAEFQAYFSEAFDSWNDTLKAITGRTLLTYEHVGVDDPRSAQLTAGDVRYNILEWDLVNQAPYGGLGPSIASQTTGQIFSANTLVQGPRIVEIYSDWFRTQEKAEQLRAAGEIAQADALILEKQRALRNRMEKLKNTPTFQAKFGQIELRIPSQEAALEDPAIDMKHFHQTPTGETYESYMKGYWREIVTHELGHNLGLRHNFRGNLGADKLTDVVSSSVMEYLGRPFRHKNKIGKYDVMALSYGYAGIEPDDLTLFCTDEHVATASNTALSAECSKADGTGDPFSDLESLVKRSFDLVVARGSAEAPTFLPSDVKSQFESALTGMGLYSASAQYWAKDWTNFSYQGDVQVRPTEPDEIAAYVQERLNLWVCDPSLDVEVKGKATQDAKDKAVAGIEGLRVYANGVISALSLEPITCNGQEDEGDDDSVDKDDEV